MSLQKNPFLPHRQFDRNEGSTILLELTSLDKDKVLTTPSNLEYRIDDITNNRQILDWTDVPTPSSTETITITPANNQLRSRSATTETRQVTTNTTDSSGNVSQDIFIYRLIRIFDKETQLI